MKSTLVGLFGRSPFGAMQHHMDLVTRCAGEVVPLIAAAIDGKSDELFAARERVDTLEHDADKAKDEIRGGLPRSLLMPVDRRDLLAILQFQDSIANAVQDVAGLLCMHPVPAPAALVDDLPAFAETIVAAVEKCHEIIGSVDELLELGFRGREVDRVEALVDELSALESKTDKQGMALTAVLFRDYSNHDVAIFVQWFELLRKMGNVADSAESVGSQLRLLLAR